MIEIWWGKIWKKIIKEPRLQQEQLLRVVRRRLNNLEIHFQQLQVHKMMSSKTKFKIKKELQQQQMILWIFQVVH